MAGVLSDITGAGEAIDGVSKTVGTLEDALFRAFPGLDKGEVVKFAQDMQEKQLDATMAAMHDQTEVTRVEAANPNWFIAAPRAALLWVCVAGVAWQYVGGPVILFIFAAFGRKGDIFPELNGQELMGLVTALLGLSGYQLAEHLTGNAPSATGIITTKTIRKALPVK